MSYLHAAYEEYKTEITLINPCRYLGAPYLPSRTSLAAGNVVIEVDGSNCVMT